jgi:hypothetical protein
MIPISDPELERRVVRYEFAKRAMIVLTTIMVAVSLGILIVLASQNQTTLRTVQSCTQPTGHCYRDGQKRTASAVASINNVVILAAACSAGLPPNLTVLERQSRIQSCVIDRLAQHKR